MNNVNKFNRAIYAFISIAIFGYGICILSVFLTVFQGDLRDRIICLNSDCVERFIKAVEPALSVGKATSDLLVAIATAGGILIALWSYLTSVSNSALGNHISHFSIFQSYLNSEIAKRNRVNIGSIDTFYWYNLVFPKSKSGIMVVSKKYKNYIEEIRLHISESNAIASTPTGETFRYKPHQAEMQNRLSNIGITISMQPRIEYYEIEDQLISLIDCINSSFCLEEEIQKVGIRKYS
ncbi:retron Ec48 family effector membrane protein [Janthinobacterium sp. 75]|uniref:retron Ec48 family effector membrane protein n=1 Tax=Janthinobacterium sp. 75 TaxID=2135628 RepID=UPI001062CD74|nr:retron Ec48 family effector membrane protein [Janthinobacterium sp. 75]TDY35325.1 hypothetical protein C8C89_3178 [Janthinobacterium sp. 75]